MVLGTDKCLLKRACELGFDVHVFGLKPPTMQEYLGKRIIFHKQDILDYDSLWKSCKELRPKGVVSVSSELAMHPMHYLLRKIGIPCNSLWTEQTSTNKYLMRKAMNEAGLDSPKFALITELTTKKEIEKLISNFEFPLIIKPVDMSASRGVMKIDRIKDLQEALSYSLKWSKNKQCILEECVSGPEYSGECIAYNGKYSLLAITEKTTTGSPHFIEKSHHQPASLTHEMELKVKETLFRAFKSLKIEYGAIHPEFRITKDGRILFMEIATRMGGGHIGTELTPLSSGYDFLGMVIDICCGKEPVIRKGHATQIAEVHYVLSKDDVDKFHRIKNDKSYNIVYAYKSENIPPVEVLNNIDRLGYYIVTKKIK